MAKLSIMGIAQERAPPEPPPVQTTFTPIVSVVAIDHAEEIRQCLDRIEKTDEDLMKLDDLLEPHLKLINDPITDPWDRLESEMAIEPILKQRSHLTDQVYIDAHAIAVHATALIDGWHEHTVDDIGRQLIQGCGSLGRIEVEEPGVLTHPSWRLLVSAACPF